MSSKNFILDYVTVKFDENYEFDHEFERDIQKITKSNVTVRNSEKDDPLMTLELTIELKEIQMQTLLNKFKKDSQAK